ncbi:hypothetical protein MMC10_011330 [Thelotrema lepadinum]|nr:hypothetical protein [Thelotrema lepadinum]
MTAMFSKAYPTAVEATPIEKLSPISETFDDAESITITKEAERKIIMKTDLHVLPILFLLFLVSFVDRTNIGNAKIEGLTTDLHMVGNQYNIAVFVFNIPYVLLDIPSNMLLRRWKPNIMLSGMMFCWGLCTIGQGLTQSYHGLLVCRVLMGVCEAGFVPGAAYLIGSYYKRHEFQFRYSFFFSAAILAGAFSGFLAFLLVKLDGAGGYAGWRWIFLIEGIVTCCVAFAAFWLIVPWPEQAKFFTPEEKSIFLARLRNDRQHAKMDHGNLSALFACLRDWKIWLFMLAYFGADNTASSFASFQPTIVQGLGYTASQANVYTIPVYMVALVIALSSAYLSDRLKMRYPFTMLGTAMAITGWAIQRSQAGGPRVLYFSLFLAQGGTQMLMPVLVVWLSNNMGGSFKRGFAIALQIGFGNTANFVSANVFLPQESPRFTTAYSVGLGLQCLSMVCCTILATGMWRENKKRDRLAREAPSDVMIPETEEEERNLGDENPAFRYTL